MLVMWREGVLAVPVSFENLFAMSSPGGSEPGRRGRGGSSMKYRKRPVVIEAFLWTGGPDQTEDPEWIIEAIKNGKVRFVNTELGCRMQIETLEGSMVARPGDFIIQGVKGEIYPCKPDIFEATYERVES
jgi:hypothetical protein